jgi:hypothetical protein
MKAIWITYLVFDVIAAKYNMCQNATVGTLNDSIMPIVKIEGDLVVLAQQIQDLLARQVTDRLNIDFEPAIDLEMQTHGQLLCGSAASKIFPAVDGTSA